MKLRELGYDVERMPASILVLLENAARNAGKVHGALEAAHALARWPATVDSETPFMPYRVLLQDYTGVPLIVDLAGMRDAASKAGLSPSRVNSKVPIDLVIDHSIQVDAWGNELAFGVNLEKEYGRNSERYALLKWAQSSFEGLRVFPPGKGICHQFNLEYLSKVVTTSSEGGELLAFPDTLIGTDSHTTMVNGIGVLGWGVGGIEAEAVMLGEPYYMPIPKVFGVKLVGDLREGVTPTDLVLTVTEKLRGKNVVGSFVEYFGEGYRRLTAQDRATLGNMSPEYGATVGFCPPDQATLDYLVGTARPLEHVDFVKRYAKLVGIFADSEKEARYSEVVVVDLDDVEPSVAGPRNPEERRPLRTMPTFARQLLGEKGAAPHAVGVTAGGGQQLLAGTSSGSDGRRLRDGAVVISAITSCTNTSNPTVMVGAALVAKKAVEMGLRVKPWVKPSFAPGSTVVTDYLQKAGLSRYLDQLGFSLVGYGCTTCIAAGTPVLLADGTSRPIESLPSGGGARLFGPVGSAALRVAVQSQLMDRGARDCVRLVLEDGRSLVCTPDHMILRSDGRWARADELTPGEDRVTVGIEGPRNAPGADEEGYVLRAGEALFSMDSPSQRARMLAFARLVGHFLNDGSISVYGQGRMNVGQAMDREMVLADLELLTGVRPAAKRYDERKRSIVLPVSLTRAIASLAGVQVGRRMLQPPAIPLFVKEDSCPVAVVREFLGGAFGADGHSPSLHRWGSEEHEAGLEPPAFSFSTVPEDLPAAEDVMRELVRLLDRCGVATNGAKVRNYPTRRGESTYPPAQDGIPRVEVRLELPDGLSFVERVGFRYCVDKMARASSAAVYWRLVRGVDQQRLWMGSAIREAKASFPSMTFPQARQAVVASLLGHEEEASLPAVVSPHYALLEGHDRFSRLPNEAGRHFRPMRRDGCDFPSPTRLFREMGVLDWFSSPREGGSSESGRCAVEEESTSLPAFSLKVVARRDAGRRHVYDLAVDDIHAFVAGTVAVHNCIGNSGPLSPEVEATVKKDGTYAVAVLSGNRNFDGRIHPLVKGSFLMSPMLVVAYALAGNIDFDFERTPLGESPRGGQVFLRDVWPKLDEIKESVQSSLTPDLYASRYAGAAKGDSRWESLASYSDPLFHWEAQSTYVRRPPWFDADQSASAKADILGARALALLEDKVTTDHISPAGTIAVDGPAGIYLLEHGVQMLQFSSFGARRGNDEVMVRGGFSNIRLHNLLAKKEGGFTLHIPSGNEMSIYDASVAYVKEGTPLIVLAGKQYGMGSSRDWAAKAPKLLGVRAVIAEDFERIHRSNLVAMGVLPLQFTEGESVAKLGLIGTESFDILGVSQMDGPRQTLDVVARGEGGEKRFRVLCRIDNATEMRYVESGGVLPYVFGKIAKAS